MIKKRNISIALSLVGAVLFSGCASIISGGSQTITVHSPNEVKGKMTYSDGSGTQYFTAPATLNVNRKGKDIILTSDNGEFNTVTVKSGLNPAVLGNILTGGVIGSTTDSISGAAWRYDEDVTISVNQAQIKKNEVTKENTVKESEEIEETQKDEFKPVSSF